MRALRVADFNQTPRIDHIPAPNPSSAQVRISVRACGLNFADLLMQNGTYQDTPNPPFTLGMEVSGDIDAVGDAVTEFAVGDRVAAFLGHGGLADHAVCDPQRVTKIPISMSYEHAAVFQIAYGTSHVALVHRGNLKADENLVVFGAAGGVGLAAVEIGAAVGANVIAVARGDEKLALAHASGANILIDASHKNLRQEIKKVGGADVVYDPVGGAFFDAALTACRPEARIIVIGFASGNVPRIMANHLLVKNIDVMGFYWGGYLKFRPEIIRDSLAMLSQWYMDGKIRPHIGHHISFAATNDGYDLLRERRSTGKVVVTI
ncbi:MAG: NADPH:quinone oxidoreductase family protein [Aestuariivita sp.]|nr:NADPH:quinone oxidoreductase family protein [Aestuariivita sp.]MCY4201882.1 NADPH:quinone oxidoreductase family protein [Aestuariivita sp.]MCY4288256.1 NADPH:quinone oxidoreductase family protein [Aestuariivita sp.]MCY4347155.1 NADPH:quinone oxidoreductase family protein [Aestuariivita sp.]